MKDKLRKIILIFCVLFCFGLAIYFLVYRILHPDMTSTRIFLNNWKLYIPIIPILVIYGFFSKGK